MCLAQLATLQLHQKYLNCLVRYRICHIQLYSACLFACQPLVQGACITWCCYTCCALPTHPPCDGSFVARFSLAAGTVALVILNKFHACSLHHADDGNMVPDSVAANRDPQQDAAGGVGARQGYPPGGSPERHFDLQAFLIRPYRAPC